MEAVGGRAVIGTLTVPAPDPIPAEPPVAVVASELSCEISGLTNGADYAFRVRALTGAGWGAWSDPVSVVPQPPAPARSIMIYGSRDGRFVVVRGETTGFVGASVTPWVRFGGPEGYVAGSGVRTVSDDGRFTWKRRANMETYVHFRAGDEMRSNRVIIAAR